MHAPHPDPAPLDALPDEAALGHALAGLPGRLQEAEGLRRRVWGLGLGLWGATALGAAPAAIATHPMIVPFWLMLAVLVAYVGTAGARRAFRLAYKRAVLDALLPAFGPGLRYEPGRGLGAEAFEASLVAPGSGRLLYDEDCIEGELGGRAFRMADLRAIRRVWDRFTVTTFMGFLVETPLAPSLAGHVAIVPDAAEALGGRLGARLQQLAGSRGRVVRFDDAAFERAFAVYASDEGLARAVVTDALRAALAALAARAGTPVGRTLAGDRAYTFISLRHNAFDPSPFRAATSAAGLRRVADDLRLALSAVALPVPAEGGAAPT